MLKPTRAMSDLHETFLAELFQGRMTRASGATSRDQMDGKQSYRSQRWVFAWDGKSTLGKSIGVTREMWEKAVKQSHWAMPILPLRWYGNERLTQVDADLVVIEATTLAEIQIDANRWAAAKEQGCFNGSHAFDFDDKSTCPVCGSSTYDRN